MIELLKFAIKLKILKIIVDKCFSWKLRTIANKNLICYFIGDKNLKSQRKFQENNKKNII